MSISDEGITLIKEMGLVTVTLDTFYKNALFHALRLEALRDWLQDALEEVNQQLGSTDN